MHIYVSSQNKSLGKVIDFFRLFLNILHECRLAFILKKKKKCVVSSGGGEIGHDDYPSFVGRARKDKNTLKWTSPLTTEHWPC